MAKKIKAVVQSAIPDEQLSFFQDNIFTINWDIASAYYRAVEFNVADYEDDFTASDALDSVIEDFDEQLPWLQDYQKKTKNES